MVEHDTMQLSPLAQQRMHALLPDLLGAVRARRRRRHVRRAALVVLVLFAPIAAWWANAVEPSTPREDAVAAAPVAEIVESDPTVLARCEVATTVRAEWFVDDDGLQELLRADERDAGLVRVGDRVFVSPSAIDPLPGEVGEP